MARPLTNWQIDQAPRDQPPWQAIWAQRGGRLRCPACRAVLNTTWHGSDGIPYTEGYQRGAGRPTF